ncbi:MAG: DegV family protein [Chloroflexi bacterium]|nr:MAG: DegV family protein [Chloroflexota bacterium]
MTIKIVTDSTCDLPPAIIEELGITVVPLYIHVGEQAFLDGVDLSRAEFYERLPNFRPFPKTAAPSAQVFRGIYERLAAEGATEILSIHISVSLSGTLDIARAAAAETKVVPVTVFDSQQLSLGLGFLVAEAARLAAAGRSMTEILSVLEEKTRRTHVIAALDTLDYLERSGRMNVVVSRLGKLLRIKPLLKMNSGKPTAERVRTSRRAEQRLIELLTELAPLEKIALVHASATQKAEALRQKVLHLLPAGEVLSVEITPVLGAHLGPGAVGFAFISAK